MADPFHITGPAVISFSGGRTSGYMLWRILQSHGGTLPNDVVVCFANTGREMPATLDFVQECGAVWGAPVVWLEFTRTNSLKYNVVNHNQADRTGIPFAEFLSKIESLPNPKQRSCTQELKIRTIKRYIVNTRRWKNWKSVVGLRADEPKRVEKKRLPSRERWTVEMPLADAGITKPDVLAFWKSQSFDLQLSGPWEGNCDGCFLKSRSSLMWMWRHHPERMTWWARMESVERGTDDVNRRFQLNHESYAGLQQVVAQTPLLIPDETMHELGQDCDAYCGV